MSLLKKMMTEAVIVEPHTVGGELVAKPSTPAEISPPEYPLAHQSLLNEATEKRILDNIALGAFPRQAAQAAGIDPNTFDRWMRHTGDEYKSFQRKVNTAIAEARVSAEMIVKATDPKFWLTHGPGKHRDDEPGWGPAASKVEGKVLHAHAHVHGTAGSFDFSALSDAELDALDELTSKVKPKELPAEGETSEEITDAEFEEAPE